MRPGGGALGGVRGGAGTGAADARRGTGPDAGEEVVRPGVAEIGTLHHDALGEPGGDGARAGADLVPVRVGDPEAAGEGVVAEAEVGAPVLTGGEEPAELGIAL